MNNGAFDDWLGWVNHDADDGHKWDGIIDDLYLDWSYLAFDLYLALYLGFEPFLYSSDLLLQAVLLIVMKTCPTLSW